MAVLASNALTLADWAKTLDADGNTADIVELLNQTNEILDDMLWVQGNLPTGHRVVVRTGLPTVYWRALNRGVPKSKSTNAQVDEGLGMLEAYSEVDKDLLALNGNEASFRMSEDKAFIEAMNIEQAETLFYGNVAVDPKAYTGLSARYSSLSATNGTNIIDAGGTGTDNTSVWLVVWGDNTVFGTFPKGSKAGLQQRDLGEHTVYDADDNMFQAMRSHYQWKCGLVVKDWRYVVRIANIDVSNLIAESSAADLIKLMIKAIAKIPNLGAGRAVFYMNRSVWTMLSIQGLGKSSNAIAVKEAVTQFGTPGKVWSNFLGVPMRRVDAILNTEARVV